MKKLMAVIAALAVALTLTSCDFLGKGKTSGTKWNTKMTVDGTSITKKYRRFIKQLSTSEKVTDIKSTITVDLEKSTIKSNDGNAVVGIAFDFHTTKVEGVKTFDFVLVGIAPETNKFYIERYENISSEKAKSISEEAMKEDDGDSAFDTDDSSMGSGDAPYVAFSGSFPMSIDKYISNDWKDLPSGSYTETEGESYEINFRVEQATAGTYDIYLGNTKVATYAGKEKCTDAKNKDNYGKCWGGAAVYANTPKGCKVVVKYAQDKEATNGLFADEEF